MDQSEQLAARFSGLFLDGKWIANTNVTDLLSDVHWEMANIQMHGLNTLLKLTFHIHYYLEGVLQVLNGGPLEIRDKYSFDCQHIRSEDDWKKLKLSLEQNAIAFVSKIKQLTTADLQKNFIKTEYGNYQRNIEGLIEHTYYHFGQMVLIKKIVLAD